MTCGVIGARGVSVMSGVDERAVSANAWTERTHGRSGIVFGSEICIGLTPRMPNKNCFKIAGVFSKRYVDLLHSIKPKGIPGEHQAIIRPLKISLHPASMLPSP